MSSQRTSSPVLVASHCSTPVGRILGLDFMTVRDDYLRFWMIWRWITGIAFTLGVLGFIWDYFTLTFGKIEPAIPESAAKKPAAV